jgi:outer membrane protein assembly factor BamA
VSFSLGGDLEFRDLRATPDAFEAQLNPGVLDARKFPSVVAGIGWSNLSRSTLAIGPEDGISLSASARRRWRADDPASTTAHSVIGSGRAYKSISLWGHARHTIGVRGAYGWAESNGTTLFGIGGNTGTSIEIVPGYTVGDSPRTFFVRGFRPNALAGTQAWTANVEYRAPLAAIGRGLWPLPFFFQRVAIAGFADAGSAWCPVVATATAVCPAGGTAKTTIASVGGELLMDTTLDYDETNRFRFGFAAPVRGRDARTKKTMLYFSIGIPF